MHRNRRGLGQTEYILILAAISLAVLGAVTLFGRRVSRFFVGASDALDKGKGVDTSYKFPDLAPGSPGTTGGARTPNKGNPADYLQTYQSLLGDVQNAIGLVTGTTPHENALPQNIALPTGITEDADGAIRTSYPGSQNPPFDIADADVRERGGTLFIDAEGNLVTRNPRGGASAAVPVDTNPHNGVAPIGLIHTHPYGSEFGGDDDWPFSGSSATNGGDWALFFNRGDRTSIVRTRTAVWMIVRTAETPSPGPTNAQVVATYDAARNAALASGASDAEAGRAGSIAVARTYHVGLYTGVPGEPLHRVVP